MKNDALYPFGYGLSYASFCIKETVFAQNAISKDKSIEISTQIENTGDYEASQTIQVYVKVLQDNTPNPQLKALKKVTLKPKKVRIVHLVLNAQAFGLYNQEGEKKLYKG